MCLTGNNPQSILADIFNYYKNYYYPYSHFFKKMRCLLKRTEWVDKEMLYLIS